MSDDPSLPWYYRPAGVALLALFVLGPLALPLVWRTPAWGPRGRWIASTLIVAYTVVLGWQVWVAAQIALRMLQGQ